MLEGPVDNSTCAPIYVVRNTSSLIQENVNSLQERYRDPAVVYFRHTYVHLALNAQPATAPMGIHIVYLD